MSILMNKKIAALAIACLLAISMVSGGVFAYFSDTETSTNNTLAAGTLNLVPAISATAVPGNSNDPATKVSVYNNGDGANNYVTFQKLYPADSGTVTWVLTNAGSLPGTLNLPLASTTVTFTLGAANEIKTASGDARTDSNGFLDENMQVKLQKGLGTSQSNAEANFAYLLGNASTYVAASNLQGALQNNSTSVAASGGNCVVVYLLTWRMPTSPTQNIYMGDGAQVNITFTLTQ